MLVELSVMEQRYRAVLEVEAGCPVTEVAARHGVSGKACTPGCAVTGLAAWLPWPTAHTARQLPASDSR